MDDADIRDRFGPIPSESLEFARRVADRSLPVLLVGESGSGKTHLAKLIHTLSPRVRHPFVHADVGAVPREIFEREMFGHVRGAFTGAVDDRGGLVEAAGGGTLLLDEIGDLPLVLQAKLLTLYQERSYRRLGCTRERRISARLISATNQDLEQMMLRGRFRRDLYHRCAVLVHRIPPLRERAGEISRPGRHPTRQAGRSRRPHPPPSFRPKPSMF